MALRQFSRSLAGAGTASGLLAVCADSLTPVLSNLQLVYWDGQRSLALERRGAPAQVENSWPACLRAQGGCAGCSLQQARTESITLVPLKTGFSCRGAMVVERLAELELELLTEFAENLSLALHRLEQLHHLQARDDLRRDIEEHGQVGSWELDTLSGQGQWTEGIARIKDMAGFHAGSGKNGALRQYEPQSRKVLEQAMAQALEAGKPYDLELQMVSVQGVRKWVRNLGSPILEDGRVVKVRGFLQDISLRKAAEEAVRASQRRSDTIVSLTLAGIAIARAGDGQILEVNPALERLLEQTGAELRGRSLADLVAVPEGFHRGETVEVRVRRKSGEEGEVLLTGGAVELEGEACILSVWHDVSEMRQLDRQARIVFDMAPVGICQTEPRTGRILVANQRFCEMTGYRLEELQRKTIRELSHPEDNLRQNPIYRAVSRGQLGEYEVDKRYVRKDGSIAWVHAQATILRTPDGVPTLAVAVIEDITQKREADLALRASQRLYNNLVNDLEDVVFSLDGRGRLAYVNPSVRRLGYCPEELLGRPVARFVIREDRGFLRDPASKKEWRVLDRQGKVHWFRVNLNAQTRSGVAVDVTLQKNAEEQLRASQKMEAIGRLAGGVAHDFNNLLTVILSYTELALEQLPGQSALVPDLREVLQAGQRAQGLTQQLLAFSRRQVMTLEVIELHPLIASMERMLARLLGKNIAIELGEDKNHVRVRADRSQVEQVLLNLAVNARDAMPHGGRLRLACTREQIGSQRAAQLDVQAGSFARVTVSDSGCGMSQEVQSRLFEPFFTTKKQGEGTGLGLAMVYGIVRQSQGAIELESAPEQGTTFHIWLPACLEEAPTVAAESVESERGGCEKLLVIEDEPALLKLAGRSLRASGYEVVCAQDAQEALELCRREGEQFDLVLSDVMIPGLNGADLVKLLRPMCPRARFLLMSGYPSDALAEQGVHDYLSKPFDAPRLRQAVRRLLDQSQPAL